MFNVTHSNDYTMVTDEIIERVYELREQGLSYRKISKKIKREGGKVSKSQVQNILSDDFDSETTEADQEELIQEDEIIESEPQAPQKRVTLSKIIGESETRDPELEGIMGREIVPTRIIRDPIEAEFFAEDQDLAREARRLRLEELIARRKAKIDGLRNDGKTEKKVVNVGNDVLGGILEMAQANPVQAKEFLDSLTQEHITKLTMLGSVGNPQAMLPFIKSNETTLHDIVEIMEMMQPEPKTKTVSTAEEVAMLMKALAETDKVQTENVQN